MQCRVTGSNSTVLATDIGCMGMNHAYGAPADKMDVLQKAVSGAYPQHPESWPAKESAEAADITLTPKELTQIGHALNPIDMSAVFGGSKISK